MGFVAGVQLPDDAGSGQLGDPLPQGGTFWQIWEQPVILAPTLCIQLRAWQPQESVCPPSRAPAQVDTAVGPRVEGDLTPNNIWK